MCEPFDQDRESYYEENSTPSAGVVSTLPIDKTKVNGGIVFCS
jgi:hypothetical protein